MDHGYRVRPVETLSSYNSWALLGPNGSPVAPADQFLSHLSLINRSPNTVLAYARDLKSYFSYLSAINESWDTVSLEDVSGYIGFLRQAGPDNAGNKPRAKSTIRRHLAAISSFYVFHSRRGTAVGHLLDNSPSPKCLAASDRPFLHHAAHNFNTPHLAIPFRADSPHKRDPTLDAEQILRVLDACKTLRDRLLISTLYETGMRLGEALGIHIVDVDPQARSVTIQRRENENGARVKSLERVLPVSSGYIELYNEYLDVEFGLIESEFLFVNLRPPVGRPMQLLSTAQLLKSISHRSDVTFTSHSFRHTFATALLRNNVSSVIVQHLLGHRRASSTSYYEHLNLNDLRRELGKARYVQEEGKQ